MAQLIELTTLMLFEVSIGDAGRNRSRWNALNQ
jgi:hypothetical protein